MTEQERKEKAIREYNELYPKFKAEYDRGVEAIEKWMEHQDEPEQAKHYKAILDESVANCNAMAERFATSAPDDFLQQQTPHNNHDKRN